MHKLRFTGSCDLAGFNEACAKHDFWYHSYYFDNGFQVVGDYNIGLDVHDYGFPQDMTGMKVLDIGTGSGWFAHYFEQQGAEVTTVDARGYCDFDVRGRHHYPPIESEKSKPDRIAPDGSPIYYSPVSGGFWVMKDLLGSKVKYVNARIYDVSEELFGGEKFDLVFIGALLVHLRDPVGALMSARKVCADRLIATTPILDDGKPEPNMYLFEDVDLVSWWRPNVACFRHWFKEAGFPYVDIGRSVNLASEQSIPSPNFDGPRNPDQILRVGYARVRQPHSMVSVSGFSAEEYGWRTVDELEAKLESHAGASPPKALKGPTPSPEKAVGEHASALIKHGPDLKMATSLGFLARAFRLLVFRVLRNYHSHQQQVGQALVQTLRDLAANTDAGLETLHAEVERLESSQDSTIALVGRELRRLAESYEDSLQAISKDTKRLGELVGELERQIEELKGAR